MKIQQLKYFAPLWGTLFFLLSPSFAFSGGGSKATGPSYEVSLYNGIKDIVRLGESLDTVLARAGKEAKRLPAAEVPDSELGKIEEMLDIKDLGVRVYFRYGVVTLIEMQPPFRGSIIGKKLELFPFSSPPNDPWRETLIKEFGQPESMSVGGRFNSEALFYNWGDIAYNRAGPNELALYRSPEVRKFRQNNFGKRVDLDWTKK